MPVYLVRKGSVHYTDGSEDTLQSVPYPPDEGHQDQGQPGGNGGEVT